MITGVMAFLGTVIGAMIARRRARRAVARAAAGEAVFFRVGVNRPNQGRRYSPGRVPSGSEFRWEPRWSWTRLRELPTDLRYVRARDTTFREFWWLPTDALVIECESSAGPVRLCVHAEQVAQVVAMIRRTAAPDLPKP